jgi:hypothetical protein
LEAARRIRGRCAYEKDEQETVGVAGMSFQRRKKTTPDYADSVEQM